MTRKTFLTLACLLVVWSLVITSLAQAPTQPTSRVIAFTGFLPDYSGDSASLLFRMYPTATGGVPVFQETQTVAVTEGAFSAFIGNETPGGIPPQIFRDHPSLWIAFALSSDPNAEIGERWPITAAGYAFKANNAADAQTAVSAQSAQTAATAQTLNPGATVSGNLSGAILTLINGHPNGTAGLFMNSGGGDLIQGKRSADQEPVFRLFNDGGAYFAGNVGIGKRYPGERLDVAGASNSIEQFYLRNESAPNKYLYQGIRDLGGGVHIARIGTFETGRSAFNLILQDSGGNVGIGTTSPGAKLDVNGNVRAGNIFANSNVGIGTASPAEKLEIVAEGNTALRVRSVVDSAALQFYVGDPRADSRNWTIRNRYNVLGGLEFARSAAAGGDPSIVAMLLDKDGNVGIGTTTPRNLLHVSKTGPALGSTVMRVDGQNIGHTNYKLLSMGHGGSEAFVVDAGGSLAINGRQVINGGGRWVGDPTGLIGPQGERGPQGPPGPPGTFSGTFTGDTTFNGRMSVGYGGGYPGLLLRATDTRSGAEIGLKSGNNEWTLFATGLDNGEGREKFIIGDKRTGAIDRLVIDSSGNVGIGTTRPAAKLHVEGNFTATGAKCALVETASYGKRRLYAMESPENWFEDFGAARLKDGHAIIHLDPIFSETVNTENEYHVFLTPTGDCLLSVQDKSPTSFGVKQLFGTDSTCKFDYRVVAKRKGYEQVRLGMVNDR